VMDDRELEWATEDTAVYALLSPEHKRRIVQALQRLAHVAALTRHGGRHAPVVMSAHQPLDVDLARTDLTTQTSALGLPRDNFATIVAAVEEGRRIYENIRKFIRYLLASNVGEILTMLLAMLAGLPLPLVPIQILWVNLVTDGLPAMALGVDQPESDLMQQK